ncbi:MAG: HAMP domain-containing histidine kinase [Oligoflexia bacterium]|nr:HAMP domain-containing histidine kinase [Oligoflexia bacterium]MBF0367000.1 HAMP domain-containing histidine kinase [Oligoflexia bacterium]
MRGIYNFSTISSSTGAPLFIKIVKTFSLWLVLFFIIGVTLFSIYMNRFDNINMTRDLVMIFASIVGASFLIAVIILTLLIKKSLFPLLELIHGINILDKFRSMEVPEDASEEIEKIYSIVNENMKRLEQVQGQLLQVEKEAAIGKMARQVSHDIRSPLAALNMIVRQNLQELPEDKRISIRQQIDRIQDIANSLLSKNKDHAIASAEDKAVRIELLSSIVEEIITEKRLNFRSHLGITIEGDIYDNTSYGLFAKITLREMKRLLSNLINNAVEALPEHQGNIIIKLQPQENKDSGKNHVQIIIEDNGKGIPLEILAKLGQEGISHGKEQSKESGNGLGLYHARTTVEGLGGKFAIESQEGVGTRMIITLPRVDAPTWFVPMLSLTSKQAIVILDDDQGIHQTWNNRFKEYHLERHNIEVIHLSTPNALRDWIHTHRKKYQEVLYLSDFELLGFKETGLDLIEEGQLKNAILVTSYYENEKIRDRCGKLGVRLIPKMLAGFVPVEIKAADANADTGANREKQERGDHYDCVYVDDDEWLRRGWEKAAKVKGIKLLTLSTTRNFTQHQHNISKEKTLIYLDSSLGESEMRGEDFAVILHQEGYKKLYLATGYDADQFTHLNWLNVIGKDCPFEEENC